MNRNGGHPKNEGGNAYNVNDVRNQLGAEFLNSLCPQMQTWYQRKREQRYYDAEEAYIEAELKLESKQKRIRAARKRDHEKLMERVRHKKRQSPNVTTDMLCEMRRRDCESKELSEYGKRGAMAAAIARKKSKV